MQTSALPRCRVTRSRSQACRPPRSQRGSPADTRTGRQSYARQPPGADSNTSRSPGRGPSALLLGDARALAADAQPLAVAIDEDVHVARDDLGRLALYRTDEPLG